MTFAINNCDHLHGFCEREDRGRGSGWGRDKEREGRKEKKEYDGREVTSWVEGYGSLNVIV